jgi:hypothetical protein
VSSTLQCEDERIDRICTKLGLRAAEGKDAQLKKRVAIVIESDLAPIAGAYKS